MMLAGAAAVAAQNQRDQIVQPTRLLQAEENSNDLHGQ